MFSAGLSSGERGGIGSREILAGHGELVGGVPSGLIEQDDGVGAGSHGPGDFGQVQSHRLGGAAGQDQAGALALLWADGAEDIGRAGAPVVRGCGAAAAPGPAPGELVHLANPGLVPRVEPEGRLWNQISIGRPRRRAAISATRAGKFF